MFELQIHLDNWNIWKHNKYGNLFISKSSIKIPDTDILIELKSPGECWSLDSNVDSYGWRFISNNLAVHTDWRLQHSELDCIQDAKVWVKNSISIRDHERSIWESYIDNYTPKMMQMKNINNRNKLIDNLEYSVRVQGSIKPKLLERLNDSLSNNLYVNLGNIGHILYYKLRNGEKDNEKN